MSEDKELLELAAKAIGLVNPKFIGSYDDYYWGGATWGIQAEGMPGLWNPLEDSSDALDLAGNLHMELHIRSSYASAEAGYGPHTEPYTDLMSKNSAIRRAIVRAAAEDGKRHD